MEEQSEARDGICSLCDQHFSIPAWTEQRLAEPSLSRHRFVGQPLVLGELANQLSDHRNVCLASVTDSKHGVSDALTIPIPQ